MINSVSSLPMVKNVQHVQTLNPQPVQNKVPTPVCNNCGAEALASYNKAVIPQFKPKKPEPALPTVLQPAAIKVLEGERITNSNGTLHSIVRKTPETTTTYIMDVQAPNDAISQIKTIDNKTGKIIRIQKNENKIEPGKLPVILQTEIYDFYPNSDNVKKLTVYGEGKVEYVEESEFGSNGFIRNYTTDENHSYIEEEWPDKFFHREIIFDKNDQITSTHTFNTKNNTSYLTVYENGKPVKVSKHQDKIVENTSGKNPLADPEIVPAKPYILGYDPKTLPNSEKAYYSNGSLERIHANTTGGGEITFLYNPDGKLECIDDRTNPDSPKFIRYSESIGHTITNRYTVEETLPNGLVKCTDFIDDGKKIVHVTQNKDDLTGKFAVYAKEGYLETYIDDFDKDNSVTLRFDRKGNTLARTSY